MTVLCSILTTLAVPYGSGPSHVGDLYLPTRVTSETPVVLSIHGGGWSHMKRQDVRGIAEFLAENGCAVYNVDYRLAKPATPWPACGDDCLAAAKFVLDCGLKAHGLSPSRIWTAGASAGGHLALWTGLRLPQEQVAGIISISGVADPRPDAAVHPQRYRRLFGGREPTADDFDSMDVCKLLGKSCPRILLTHAREDSVVPEASARNFYLAAAALGDVAFSQYSCKDEPNAGGHCIWRKGVSDPRRLIGRVERAIVQFMGLPGLGVYDYAGEDFARMFTGNGWQASYLAYGPTFAKPTYLERHLATDELFVLLAGEATLFVGEEMKSVKLEQGRLYNVRRATWHQIAVTPGTKVLVVENAGDVKTEKRPLTNELK